MYAVPVNVTEALAVDAVETVDEGTVVDDRLVEPTAVAVAFTAVAVVAAAANGSCVCWTRRLNHATEAIIVMGSCDGAAPAVVVVVVVVVVWDTGLKSFIFSHSARIRRDGTPTIQGGGRLQSKGSWLLPPTVALALAAAVVFFIVFCTAGWLASNMTSKTCTASVANAVNVSWNKRNDDATCGSSCHSGGGGGRGDEAAAAPTPAGTSPVVVAQESASANSCVASGIAGGRFARVPVTGGGDAVALTVSSYLE